MSPNDVRAAIAASEETMLANARKAEGRHAARVAKIRKLCEHEWSLRGKTANSRLYRCLCCNKYQHTKGEPP